MKKLLSVLVLTAALCAAKQYQTCGLITQTGELVCGNPQSKQSAEMQALVYNAVSQGAFIAWARPVPKGKKKPVAPPAQPVTTPQVPAAIPQTN